jgi:hypothetical protein
MVFSGTTDLTFLTLQWSRSIIRFQSSLIGYGTLKDVHYKLKIQVPLHIFLKSLVHLITVQRVFEEYGL